MRCKKHLSDCSSVAGVCASCLRERLLTIIEKQSGYEDELLVEPQTEDEHRKADAIYERVTFPRSVSPYVSRRKSDNTAVWPHVPLSGTPEIGANGMITKGERRSRDSRAGFSSLSNLFRSKTSKFVTESNSDFGGETRAKKSNFINSTMTEAQQTKSPSSWFMKTSKFVTEHNSDFGSETRPRKSNSMNSTMTEAQQTKPPSSWFKKLFISEKKRNSDIISTSFPQEYECSGQTCPRSTPMQATPQRRKQNQGLSFCLSPLVRARPSRSWNPKGGLPETVIQSGDMKGSPGRPGLSVAASSGANRSRKLANFGRFRANY
ncbi:hypothetical protein DCAR_0414926 [Daucus carota subsp. sativus]|uniref:Uncharacterized protein n=1 Tax=Daucus carota subsp. sativus TaxID=79200 RepID=A0A165A3M6_DAUCS|nr:PREDICTED: uncharacterized protein LOC108218018 [Daucus carota subsp. sativus]WOG95601.1 hypothetical protein DCAR_0414926 [Daucus carota subsp. sativus]